MKTLSWILLALVGLATLFFSAASARLAYRGGPDSLGPVPLGQLAPEAAVAVQARRGTAASYAMAYAVLFLMVVLGPYRRGEAWGVWAVSLGSLVLGAAMLLRVPLLHTLSGAPPAAVQLIVTVLALVLRGLARKPSPPTPSR